jgi:hypothetical protein
MRVYPREKLDRLLLAAVTIAVTVAFSAAVAGFIQKAAGDLTSRLETFHSQEAKQ